MPQGIGTRLLSQSETKPETGIGAEAEAQTQADDRAHADSRHCTHDREHARERAGGMLKVVLCCRE